MTKETMEAYILGELTRALVAVDTARYTFDNGSIERKNLEEAIKLIKQTIKTYTNRYNVEE